MKNAHQATINGRTYGIQCHPWNEGAAIAFELGRAIRSHVLASQKPTMAAMAGLSDEDKKRLDDAPNDEARSKLWVELVMPKIDQSQLLDGAISFLQGMDSEKMSKLVTLLFKYVPEFDPLKGIPYKDVVPLMKEVIEHNDFLDLDASDLLQVMA